MSPDFEPREKTISSVPPQEGRGSGRFSVERVVRFLRDRDLIPPKRESIALAIGVVIMSAAELVVIDSMKDDQALLKFYLTLPLVTIPFITLAISDKFSGNNSS